MWVMVQKNENGKKIKFVTSESYDDLINYINKFLNVKKYDDYNFTSNDEEIINFSIHLSDFIGRR